MDSQAKDVIAKDVADNLDKHNTFRQALNDVLSKNESLKKSESWSRPTKRQKKALRDRITSDKRTTKKSITKKDGVEYIQVNKGNYRKVLAKDDYYYDSETNTAFIRRSNGWYKEKIH